MQKVIDVVCGMELDPATAPVRIVHGGRTYHFCGSECERKFLAEPGRYADARTSPAGAAGREGMEQHEPPHTTTGWFTAPKFGSAGSGGLEYEPLPEAHPKKPAG